MTLLVAALHLVLMQMASRYRDDWAGGGLWATVSTHHFCAKPIAKMKYALSDLRTANCPSPGRRAFGSQRVWKYSI